MIRKVLHSKIHNARVTAVNPGYSGSILIDDDLLRQCGMRANDAVTVANFRTGSRFETYVFEGNSGSGAIEINGAAALLAEPGDTVIVLHFAHVTDAEYARHRPRVLIMNPEDNTVEDVVVYEPGSSLAGSPLCEEEEQV